VEERLSHALVKGIDARAALEMEGVERVIVSGVQRVKPGAVVDPKLVEMPVVGAPALTPAVPAAPPVPAPPVPAPPVPAAHSRACGFWPGRGARNVRDK
jgi:hypothetical protein